MTETVEKNHFKIVVLGKSSVGKTCLIHRFVHDSFCENMSKTLGVAYYSKSVLVDGRELKLQIWDTAGQERFNCISRMYYRRARVAIVCVDVTDLDSFDKMNYWLAELHHNEKDCRIYICCTKKDLVKADNRVISEEAMKERAEACRGKVFNSSSKTGEGVQQLFEQIAEDLLSDNSKLIHSTDEYTIKLSTKKSRIKRSKCCKRK